MNENLRNELYQELEEFGPEHMHRKLLALDPETDIHPNNTRRVVRALEIQLGSEEQVDRSLALEPMYNELIIGIDIARDILYERIDQRVETMFEEGLLEEVDALYKRDLRDVQSIKAIGYKEVFAYFDGIMDLEEAKVLLKKNSRNYAKRQLTYFRNKLPVYWIDGLRDLKGNIEEIRQFMQENDRARRIRIIVDQKKN